VEIGERKATDSPSINDRRESRSSNVNRTAEDIQRYRFDIASDIAKSRAQVRGREQSRDNDRAIEGSQGRTQARRRARRRRTHCHRKEDREGPRGSHLARTRECSFNMRAYRTCTPIARIISVSIGVFSEMDFSRRMFTREAARIPSHEG